MHQSKKREKCSPPWNYILNPFWPECFCLSSLQTLLIFVCEFHNWIFTMHYYCLHNWSTRHRIYLFGVHVATCLRPPLIMFWVALNLCFFVLYDYNSITAKGISDVIWALDQALYFALPQCDVNARKCTQACKALANVLSLWCAFSNQRQALSQTSLSKLHHLPRVVVYGISTPLFTPVRLWYKRLFVFWGLGFVYHEAR